MKNVSMHPAALKAFKDALYTAQCCGLSDAAILQCIGPEYNVKKNELGFWEITLDMDYVEKDVKGNLGKYHIHSSKFAPKDSVIVWSGKEDSKLWDNLMKQSSLFGAWDKPKNLNIPITAPIVGVEHHDLIVADDMVYAREDSPFSIFERKREWFSKLGNWRQLWRYEETRQYREQIYDGGKKIMRSWKQCFAYVDFDRDTIVFYPWPIALVVAIWRRFVRELPHFILGLDKDVQKYYIKGYYDSQERLTDAWQKAHDAGYANGKMAGKEMAIDEILMSYAHDVIKNQRALSNEEPREEFFTFPVSDKI